MIMTVISYSMRVGRKKMRECEMVRWFLCTSVHITCTTGSHESRQKRGQINLHINQIISVTNLQFVQERLFNCSSESVHSGF